MATRWNKDNDDNDDNSLIKGFPFLFLDVMVRRQLWSHHRLPPHKLSGLDSGGSAWHRLPVPLSHLTL